tara:strand:- start:569 stop:757 length:189 start_codon:yes stop_codon:yes gene_type:complete
MEIAVITISVKIPVFSHILSLIITIINESTLVFERLLDLINKQLGIYTNSVKEVCYGKSEKC